MVSILWWVLLSALATPTLTPQEVREAEWSRDLHALLSEPPTVATIDALGRLRRTEALDVLASQLDASSPTVRRATIDALANTPDAAPALRARLEVTLRPRGRTGRHPHERTWLLAALGRQGTSEDIATLMEVVAERWPNGPAASIALGRLARRSVEGVQQAIPPLVAALSSRDPRAVEAAAFALFRVQLDEADPTQIRQVLAAATTAATPSARAWSVRAVWPRLEPLDRAALWTAARTDDRLVRVAVLDAIGPDEMDTSFLQGLVNDDDSWIRSAAAAALVRVGQPTPVPPTTNRWVFAELLAMSPPTDNEPLPVQAARIGRIQDPVILVEYAITGDSPAIRSAAGGALLSSPLAIEHAARLLEAHDPIIREVAVELLSFPGGSLTTLANHLLSEDHPDVLRVGLQKLAEDDVSTPLPEPLVARLNDLASSPDPVLRRAASSLGGTEVPRKFIGPFDTASRELTDITRLTSATVTTTRGSFEISLHPHVAPLAVANFARLAQADFYDDVVWHRVVPGFVVQTGCPRDDGWGGPGWIIPDESSTRPYATGSVGMARSGYDTGGSQWFVTTSPQPHLVGDYTWFGAVTHGLEVVLQLERGDIILDVEIKTVTEP